MNDWTSTRGGSVSEQKEAKWSMSFSKRKAYRKELEELPLGKLELMYNTTHEDHPEFREEYIRRLRFEVTNQRNAISHQQTKLREQKSKHARIKRELICRIDRLKKTNHLLTLESFEK
jgi:hypothetical protein